MYRYLDSFLGQLVDEAPDDAWIIVASDHGAEAPPQAADSSWRDRPGAHSPSARGILVIAGPHVRKGHQLEAGDPTGLMPTLAWLSGLPLSRELIAAPFYEAFDPTWIRGRRPEYVATYGSRGGSLQRSESDSDEGLLEALRSLGYVD